MQRLTFFTLLLALITVSLLIYIFNNNPLISQYKILSSYKTKFYTKQEYVILLWTKFFDVPNWGLPSETVAKDYFKNLNCPNINCVITLNRNYLNSITDYDAVIFHGAEPFPVIQSVPSVRNEDQLYIFASQESPAETKHNLKIDYDFFNLTMTYRLDSDIKWHYNNIKEIKTDAVISPNLNPIWRPVENISISAYDDDDNDDDNRGEWIKLKELIDKKNKIGAWFVSHCNVFSKRKNLMSKLQNYIPIDIYGECGNLSCPKGSALCDKLLDNNYKFYFALENSLCIDYVTEKLFNTLKRNIVPVVFGGANYNRFVPPKSYINVEDFKSIEKLADYLLYLDRNPLEYLQYFWWKKYYKVEYDKESGFCQLCTILNQPNRHNKKQIYSDIENWWLGNSCRNKSKLKELK